MATATAPQGYSYSGNNDFRGYIAANAPQYLDYVGNDGGINVNKLGSAYNQAGDFNFNTANPSTVPSGQNYQKAVNDIKGLYSTFSSANSSGAYTPTDSSGSAASKALINGQLGQLDPQQSIGLNNIANSYNLSANRLDEQNAAAQRDYGTGTQQNTQGYQNTRNGIMTNTAATASALKRLLGINGAGNSSAAYEQAPYAAGLQGSQNLNQAQQTYGNNQSSLDTNWQDTQRSYNNSKQDLETQRYQQENALRSSIAQTRASLLGQMSNPDTNAINGLLGQITQLGQQYANPVLRANDISFKAPDAASYTLGQNQAPTGQAGAANDINPTFLGLLTGQRDQYGNLVG